MLTYTLFKTQGILLSATSRKGQPETDLHPVQNPEHALVSNKQEGPARHWLTNCSKPRPCCCQQQAGRASQMLTYKLFKNQSMLLSAISMKVQPAADLQAVQNPEHAQLSVTSRKGQPDADLHPVQNPQHALVSNKQKELASCWLTYCWKFREFSCQQQGKSQPNIDLHPVQNPDHALVSNKQEGTARCWLTNCWIPRPCSCQQQAGKVSQLLTYKLLKNQSMLLSTKAGRCSQMLTYKLFNTQTMLLSATSRKGQPDADSQSMQNPSMLLSATSRKSQPDVDLHAAQYP